jgi:DNA-binding beta-propeller fold protein YncE
VSEPRISAFARLANGNARPTRVIAGQTARVSRTMHGIFYDPKHDEIVVPVALGGAVLTLPGGANGGDPPLRVLQGPRTGLVQPDTLYVDVTHDEMIVDSGDDSLLVFPRTATGDTAPIRKIGGPKTHIRNIYGMTVDAIHNLIIVGNRVEVPGTRESVDGILIFNRTDNGDVEPRAVIAGPKTGIIKIRQVVADDERGQIFATIKNNFENYDASQPQPSPWNPDRTGFIGVWSIDDNGDVPPRGVIKGPASGLIWPAGVAINPAQREVYAIDSVSNALFMFHMPELFKAAGTPTAQDRIR